jgi:arylsulfatase A
MSSMDRRTFLRTSLAGAALAALPRAVWADDPSARKPNIVLILADDLGYECLGCNGGTSYRTPHLDRLAATGMRFENCHVQPQCTPSRAQLLTGIYNVRNYINFGTLDPHATTFAHLLKKAGYATCIAGKWQLGGGFDGPRHFGFDEYCLWQLTQLGTDRTSRYRNPGLEVNGKLVRYTGNEYGPDVIAEYAAGFLARQKQQPQPFFLFYSMILPHYPWEPTPDSPDYGTKGKRTRQEYFVEMVAYMDKMVGKLSARLDELKLRDNTLVLFVGDNGTDPQIVSKVGDREVKGGKLSTTDAGTHVPCIVSQPGVVPAGRTCADLVDSTDFLPTFCDLAGAAVPGELKLDGQTFAPQLVGKEGKRRDWSYCWFSTTGEAGTEKECARDLRYKLYRNGSFYDTRQDPLEQTPLAAETQGEPAAGAKRRLEAVLDRYANARPAALLRRPASRETLP